MAEEASRVNATHCCSMEEQVAAVVVGRLGEREGAVTRRYGRWPEAAAWIPS